MSDLTFIKNLPSEFSNYYLVPANNRYPCTWGYNSNKEVYHIIQLIGKGQYLFIVTNAEYNYLGYSTNFNEANLIGQAEKVEQAAEKTQPINKDRVLLQHIEQVEKKSKANPKKVYRVSPGFYFLTVDEKLWSITYCTEIKMWTAYVDRFLEADETHTKRQMIEVLLS